MARTKRKASALQSVPIPETSTQRIYRTGGYIRLYVEDSGKPGADTIETQRAFIENYIEAREDMKLCGLFIDNGKTGMNFERPGFERLMEQVRAGKIDCIVVKDLSRFGRSYLEADNYIERIFPFLDVRFIAINDHFDTLTAEHTTDGLIVPLKNVINAAYSKDISKKSSSALATKMKNGEFIGSWAPYGYRKCDSDRHKLEPDDETAPIVQMIFQWRISGTSYLQIARRLNEQGIPSPSRYHYLRGEIKTERLGNSLWHTAMVKKILLSEVYLGHTIQGRSRSRDMIPVPESEWIVVRDTHQPIIDEDTFRKVQEMAEDCRRSFQERKGRFDALGTIPNILRGLVFCADCKCPMIRYKSVSEKCGHVYYSYICRTHYEDPASCPKKYLLETELKEILWETLRREIQTAVDMETLLKRHTHSTKAADREAALRQELSSAQKALERAETLYDGLYQSYVDRLMSEGEYMELKRQYKADMEQARNRLEDAEQGLQREKQRSDKNPWLISFEKFQGETELTEEMAHALIERVEVDAENHVSVTLRYRDEYRDLLRLMEDGGEAVPA